MKMKMMKRKKSFLRNPKRKVPYLANSHQREAIGLHPTIPAKLRKNKKK
jgi:hypothetical protein